MPQERRPMVYILTNRAGGTLYTGVTSNIYQRLERHLQGAANNFSTRYKTCMLVYAEPHGTMTSAIAREKQIKKW